MSTAFKLRLTKCLLKVSFEAGESSNSLRINVRDGPACEKERSLKACLEHIYSCSHCKAKIDFASHHLIFRDLFNQTKSAKHLKEEREKKEEQNWFYGSNFI